MTTTPRQKLGELLLQNGLVSEEQLKNALSNQVVNAGRLGSLVVEMGFTSIDAVAELLSFQLNVPAASPAQLGEIDQRVLATIPREICERYKILPFAHSKGTLHVAMQDPQREDLLDYLKRGLRSKIAAYVVPQLRLLFSLEKHHGIPRPKRFLRQPKADEQNPDQRRNYLEPTVTAEGASAHQIAPSPPPEKVGDFELIYLDQVKHEPTQENFAVEVEVPPARSSTAEVVVVSIDHVLTTLQDAETRDELVTALVQPVVPGTTLSLLLLPRGEMCVGLAAYGSRISQEQVRELVTPLDGNSLLKKALADGVPAQGRGSDDPLMTMVAGYLQAPTPQACVVVPVALGGRVVNLLCVQAKEVFTDSAIKELERIGEAAAEAYTRLIQKNQSPSQAT